MRETRSLWMLVVVALAASIALAQGPDGAPAPPAPPAAETVKAATLLADGKKELDRAPSLENYAKAVALFRQAVQVAPDFATAHHYLGVALYYTGRQVLRQNDLDLATANVSLDEALTVLAKANELSPTAPGPVLYTGLVHLLKSDYTTTDTALQAQELALAEESLAKAVDASAARDRGPAHEALGRVLVRRGELFRGLQNLDWALEIDPNYAWARYSRAQALYEMGRYSEVDTECTRLNQTLTAYKREKFNLDQLDANGRTSTDQAQQTREKFAETYGGAADFSDANMWPQVYKLQGQALDALHQFAAARSCFQQAMSKEHGGNSESPEFLTLQARALLSQANWILRVEGRVSDPRSLLKAVDESVTEILKSTENYPNALEVRGEAYMLESEVYKTEGDNKAHQLEDARDALAKAAEAYANARKNNMPYPEARSGRNYARCLASYGYVLARLGDTPKALEQFRIGLTEGDANSWPCLLYQAYTLAKSDGAQNCQTVRTLVERVTARETGLAFREFDALFIGAETLYQAGKSCRVQGRTAGQPEGDLVKTGGDLLHDAITLAERATEMAPKDTRPYMVAAAAYWDLDLLAGAEVAYRKAMELFPPSRTVKIADEKSVVLYRLAYCNLSSEIYDEAIRYANQAVAIDTSLWEAKEVAADSYAGLRRFEAADAAYAAALELAPANSADQARVLASHGHCLMLMGRMQDAELMILRALATFESAPPIEATDVARVARTQLVREQAAKDLALVQAQLQAKGVS